MKALMRFDPDIIEDYGFSARHDSTYRAIHADNK